MAPRTASTGPRDHDDHVAATVALFPDEPSEELLAIIRPAMFTGRDICEARQAAEAQESGAA